MNRQDISKLIALIHALSPAFNPDPATGNAWFELLADIPAADAAAAIKAHFATGGPWIGVADIRRRVLTARGLLPPDAETAYAQARRMNEWLDRRVGPEPAIHPTAMAAAREIRWSTFDGPEGVAHRRFVDAYTPMSSRDAEKALTTPLPALLAAVHEPKALPGGSGVEAAQRERQAIEPADPDRSKAIRDEIRRANIGKLPPPPKPDYDPPSDIERARQLAELERWATANGYKIDDEGAA